MDVGGGAPASVGAFREIYQEGVIIPPVKMVRTGTIVDDIFRLVLAQIRSKRETAGDFRAQFAANNTGVRRLTALFERYGPETVNFYMDELIAYTDRRTQAELAKLPKGEYLAEGYVDNDGFTDQPVRLVVRVLVDDDGVLFDFTGSDPQRRAPVDSTWAQTYSAAAYALKCVADPDLPVNEGFYRHVRLVAPEGTVVNCVHPFPVVAGWETQVRLNDTIFKALAQAIPEQMIAGTKAMQCHAGFGGVDPRSGANYCYLETLGGGYGDRAHPGRGGHRGVGRRLPRARHHRRHQRHHRGEAGADRLHHHRRIPGHAGDPAPDSPLPLRPAFREAAPPRAPVSMLRHPGAARRRWMNRRSPSGAPDPPTQTASPRSSTSPPCSSP